MQFSPFAEGNESRTPAEVFAVRENGSEPNGPGWIVRVVPNKFPALESEGELERVGEGVYDQISGIGAHEVVVETPNPEEALADLSEAHVQKVALAYRHRLQELSRDPRIRYILIYKNHGSAAGATVLHSHTQILGMPVMPTTVKRELESARDHFLNKERCLFCDILRQELSSGSRIVFEEEDFVAICPFASRFPFEVLLLPRHHAHDFSRTSDEQLGSFAGSLKRVLQALKKTLGDPAYNFLLHSAPVAEAPVHRSDDWQTLSLDYHWHVEIIPRLTRVAGFEWGTGFYMNPMPPEDAARYLRESLS